MLLVFFLLFFFSDVLTINIAHVPATNVSGRQFEDLDVRHDQSASGPSQRDLDKPEVRDEGGLSICTLLKSHIADALYLRSTTRILEQQGNRQRRGTLDQSLQHDGF